LVATPALSPDGSQIAFVVSSSMYDGYHAPSSFASGSAGLWIQPLNPSGGSDPVFGTPVPLPHASGTLENETFPHWSADGELLAFSRSAPAKGGYDEETATVWVMPSDGSSAPVPVAGNSAPGSDDPTAPVFHGDGLTNSWPRFGQSVIETESGSVHFLVFSSRRGPADLWEARVSGSQPVNGRPLARLYMAAIRRTLAGGIETHPAVLIPGQRVDAGAHTASFTTVTSVPPPPPEVH
jgi:Tol biopolymer transport system component